MSAILFKQCGMLINCRVARSKLCLNTTYTQFSYFNLTVTSLGSIQSNKGTRPLFQQFQYYKKVEIVPVTSGITGKLKRE